MITQAELKEHLNYDPKSGVFTWIKVHPRCTFPAGTTAGCKQAKGIRISIKRKHYFAHKLAVLYVAGYYPDENVVHKNGDYYNNKMENLIVASQAQSCIRRGNKKNTSGHKGVNWSKSAKKWEARVMVNGKRMSLGVFDNLDDAIEAYEFNRPNKIVLSA